MKEFDLERLSLSSTKVADTLARIGSYDSARDAYRSVIASIIGKDFNVPRVCVEGCGLVCDEFSTLDVEKKAELLACFVGMADVAHKQGRKGEAIDWLNECDIVYLNARWAAKPTIYDWEEYFPNSVNFAVQFARSRELASAVFLSLGNTASAVHRRYRGSQLIPGSLKSREPAIERSFLSRGAMSVLLQFRHPDPVLVQKQRLTDSSMQTRGSWTKLRIKKSASGPGRRMTFSSFIWDGHLYIAGGRKDSLGPFYRDIFSLNLTTLAGWNALPPHPRPMSTTGAFLGWQMLPHPTHKKAYVFTGRPELDYFDLVSQTWGSVKIQFVHQGQEDVDAGISMRGWPYPGTQLTDSTQQLVGDKIYIFGGTHSKTNIGCNLFCVLDISSCTLTRISGTPLITQHTTTTAPGPRKTPNSWVDKRKERMYVLFGECERNGASLQNELHGGECGHPYDDFWSYDLRMSEESEKGWRRERWVGNSPCPRSEAAVVYNPVLNKTIAWGGYNADLPTNYIEERMSFTFSYYGDTYIYDGPPDDDSPTPQPRKWRQVLTTSFPTYRAQSHLLADPISGRTFLFGGFTNSQYIPTRKDAISRSFGDLWELKVEAEAGDMGSASGASASGEAEVGDEFEASKRTATIGPWHRCFACGSLSAKDGSKGGGAARCGGSCKGKAYFCDVECLKEGWGEHKRMHGCRKV